MLDSVSFTDKTRSYSSLLLFIYSISYSLTVYRNNNVFRSSSVLPTPSTQSVATSHKMSFIISTLQSCLPQSPYINLLQATIFISFTIYIIYDQYAKTFVRPIQRAQGITTLREAMFVSLTIETEFAYALRLTLLALILTCHDIASHKPDTTSSQNPSRCWKMGRISFG